jgi:hypothetical protein
MHIGWLQLFVAIAALASGGTASALGFGPIRSTVVLGQPLNLAVPVNLADGETLTGECASAEVTAGDNKLPAGSVRVRITQGRDGNESILRISTSSVIDEPVLSVTLNAGCPTRLSRTLVLLADPPLATTAAAPMETPSLPSVAAVSPATLVAGEPSTAPTPRATRPTAPSPAKRTARAQPGRAAVANAAEAPASAAVAARPPAKAPQRPGARAEARPRLQLDAGQVSSSQAAVMVAQEQAAAAQAAASAAQASASAAGERLRSLEAEMARSREEAKAQTDALLQLRQQLALDRAQREQPSSWVMALVGLAALLAAMVVWLAWRVRKQSRVAAPRNEADWWDRDAVPSKSDVTAVPAVSEFQQPAQMPATLRMASAPAPWSDSVHADNSVLEQLISPPTMPAPREVSTSPVTLVPTHEDEANRAMSVDEQIDLEQQADFFIALGHDDAAIDLLMAHMRSTGGGSPLPFLKLLEIHRRRDQREAYERTRIRFNQRFNSVAPDWQADPKAGRTLEDYPLAMGRIQRAWPSPLDAMAEIEALLFRRGSEAELFDLPAYQEVLFLFQIARDLHLAENAGTEDVDVLLPIGGRSAPVAAAAGTIVLRPEFNAGQPVSLDLDLTTDHGEIAAEATSEPELKFTLEQVDSPQAAEPDDLWGSPPDVRPTR